ncbi:MAG: hypothetical protein Q7R83_00205 [bacterium]|nr:hypothetical protein [bacterium]
MTRYFFARVASYALLLCVFLFPSMSQAVMPPVSPTMSTVTVSATTVGVNQSFTITGVAKSDTGFLIFGKSFQIFSTIPVLTVPGGATTDWNGQAVYQASFAQAGQATLTYAFEGVALPYSHTITISDNGVSPAQSIVSVSTNTTYLHNGVTVSANARNANGTPVSGKTFLIQSSIPFSAQPAITTTDANGNATYIITFTQAGQASLTYTLGGIGIPVQHVVNVIDDTVSANQSSVSVSSLTVARNSWLTISGTARNANGSSLPGKVLAISSSLPLDSYNTVVTDGNGNFSANVRFTLSGMASMSFVLDGVSLPTQYQVRVTDDSISQSNSRVNMDTLSVPADNASVATASVIARSTNGDLLSGKEVHLSVVSAQNPGAVTILPTTAVTDVAGIARFTIRSSVGQNVTILASINGYGITDTPTITFNPSYGQDALRGTTTTPTQTANPNCAWTGSSLVKLPDDGNAKTQEDTAVYFYGSDCKRHAFPNDKVYFSWYSNFAGITTVTPSQLASMSLGKNVTYKPGVNLVKFTSLPKVYAVAKGGWLRWVTSEQVARDLYGANWATIVHDIPEGFFVNYAFGSDIQSYSDFNVYTERSVASINESL